MANLGGQYTAHDVGRNVAANTGGVQYEDDSLGSSLSGGAAPTTGQSIHGYNPANGTGASLGTNLGPGSSSVGSARPTVTDVGVSTGGQSLANQVKAANAPSSGGIQAQPTTHSASVGQAGSVSQPPTGSAYEQATRGAQVVANKAQELSQPIQPYIQKVQETVGPYVQAAVDKSAPYVQQAQQAASPYVEKASVLANQGIQATATELDKRGGNVENIQQNLKDYGTVGQERAGQYLQQAVDQAKTISSNQENKNIVATVFGTIALIWLAFGLSITALLALGVAGGLAAILSKYSRAAVGTRGQSTSSTGTSGGHSTGQLKARGVETHYPNPSHPDNSLNH